MELEGLSEEKDTGREKIRKYHEKVIKHVFVTHIFI